MQDSLATREKALGAADHSAGGAFLRRSRSPRRSSGCPRCDSPTSLLVTHRATTHTTRSPTSARTSTARCTRSATRRCAQKRRARELSTGSNAARELQAHPRRCAVHPVFTQDFWLRPTIFLIFLRYIC